MIGVTCAVNCCACAWVGCWFCVNVCWTTLLTAWLPFAQIALPCFRYSDFERAAAVLVLSDESSLPQPASRTPPIRQGMRKIDALRKMVPFVQLAQVVSP